jgi:outer membrane protein assembly factor BamB
MVDAANLSAAVDKSPADSNATDFLPGALSRWQDSAGVRGVLAPTARAIVAYKIVERNGKAAFEPGWVSPNLASPIAPMIINGVVFALASGEFRSADSKITAAQRAQRSTPAVLYALDGATGKPIWNSGKTITSFVHSAALSGQSGQVYVGTYDGTLYAFGFPMEH